MIALFAEVIKKKNCKQEAQKCGFPYSLQRKSKLIHTRVIVL